MFAFELPPPDPPALPIVEYPPPPPPPVEIVVPNDVLLPFTPGPVNPTPPAPPPPIVKQNALNVAHEVQEHVESPFGHC